MRKPHDPLRLVASDIAAARGPAPVRQKAKRRAAASARECVGCARAGLTAAVVLLVALCPGQASAQSAGSDRVTYCSAAPASQVKPAHDRIVGTWVLTSFYEEDEYGEEVEQWGLDPKGRLSFDAHGRFAFELRDDLALGLCIAYSGTYEITAEGRIRFQPDTWAMAGHDESTRAADLLLKDTLLELTSSARPSLAGSFYSHTIWRHLRDVPDVRLAPCGR
jgi:hypothetical protein